MTLSGLFTPVATPFIDDEVDEAGLRANIRKYMATGLTGIVALGSNGEAVQLDEDEADRVVAIARDEVPSGRPLIAGTGRESTRATIAATRRAAALGADAVLVRTPAFFKQLMSADVFIRHYTAVADASPVPVLLYNVTMYTGVALQVEAVARLSAHPNIVGIKDSGSDVTLIADFLAQSAPGFTVLAGSGVAYYSALAAGAHGAVLALAGVATDACVEIRALVEAGRMAEARALQQRLVPLARLIGGQYAVPGLKAALDLLGYRGGLPRPPLGPVPPAVIDQLATALEAAGLSPTRPVAAS
ncbi:MAG: dihydrodipicolinate synthase family protein [Vicinamibacterales bacterium]|nr:dihydrodipicolinate synthase family protein [Vicinamibacterales bacterium]